jgi:hypothetical protein
MIDDLSGEICQDILHRARVPIERSMSRQTLALSRINRV